MGASQPDRQLEVPGVGMRGGLGRTLLTAFLFMAIFPLGVVSWYASARGRLNIQQEVVDKLDSIATLKEAQIARWIEEETGVFSASVFSVQLEEVLQTMDRRPVVNRARLSYLAGQFGLAGLALLDSNGTVEQASDLAMIGDMLAVPGWTGRTLAVARGGYGPEGGTALALTTPLVPTSDQWSFVAIYLNSEELARILEETAGLGETGTAYLVDQAGVAFPQGYQLSSAAAQYTAGEGDQVLYRDDEDRPVIGVHRGLTDLGLVLVVEQFQEEAFAGNDAVATAVIAATLGAALFTAVIAAFVTGQITRSVVRLTESALHIAEGDLSRRVEVSSRDEIGILAHVFNRMASELEALYNDLEAKVANRTRMLQEANYQIQRRAIQMQASLEVGQAITSILDPDRLLEQVVRLVKDSFVYSYVAVYTVDQAGDFLALRASYGGADPFHGERVPVELEGTVGRVFREGTVTVESRPVVVTVGPPVSYVRSEVALPLRLRDRTLGVLDVQSTSESGLDQDDVSVLQNVANQITVALANARAYVVEREAVEQLRELDQSKRRFLSKMSHELRTPLTNIIGFSRLLLKGVEGPISEEQKNDLEIVYSNGQHLLGLINDLLDVSHLEAGLMELEFRAVDLADLIRSVMATAGALVQGGVVLREEISPNLPEIRADPARLRQVLLRLLANAAKFTDEGSITVVARPVDGQVIVSVIDTGVGILPEDQERIFVQFEQGRMEDGRRPNGAGLGLALSKEFVEMHGGSIWVESEVGKGSTFTFALPLVPEFQEGDVFRRVQAGGSE